MMAFPRGRIQYCDKPHSAIKAFAGENIDDILSWYEKMIQLNPNNKDLYFGKADLLLQKEHYEEANVVLDHLIELDQNDAMVWFKKGELLFEIGHSKDALKCYQKAVSIASVFEEAWTRIGEILLSLDDYKQARDVFQHIIDLNSSNANAVKVLLMLDEYFSRSEHPEDHMTWPGKNNKNPIEVEIDSELKELFEGEPQESEIPINMNENDIDASDIAATSKELVSKGKVLQAKGEFIKALRSFNEALELNQLCWDAWRAKGDLFLELGKTEEASFCYYKALYLALTPIEGKNENERITSESKYSQWRNKFFSSIEDKLKESKDT